MSKKQPVVPPGMTRKQKKQFKARQSAAENKAKKEQLQREREEQQASTASNPIQTAESAPVNTQQPIALPSDLSAQQQAGDQCDNIPPSTRSERTIARCTIALLVVAVVQGVAMIWQNSIMREQMGQADTTLSLMKGEQRSWLGISSPTIAELKPDKPVDCSATVKNSGSTPGYIDFGLVAVVKLPKDVDPLQSIKKMRTLADKQAQEIVIPPNGATSLITDVTPTLTEAEIAGVAAGDWRLWLIGRIVYQDTFKGKHTTDFCFYYDQKRKQVIGYEKYNSMD